MAALIPFLEVKPEERGPGETLDLSTADTLAGLGAASKKIQRDVDGTPLPPLAKSHTELTRLLWTRRLIADAVDGRAFRAEEDGQHVFIRVSPPIPEDIIPWHKAGAPLERFRLFSTNSKMGCPTFDLPAGAGKLGGACPGALAAQSSVIHGLGEGGGIPQVDRWGKEEILTQVPDANHPSGRKPLILANAVCQKCYATGGKYGEVVVQFSEVARFAFVKRMMMTDQTRKLLHDLIVYTLTKKLKYLSPSDKTSRFGIKPVRIHSSGDFYSLRYAEFWLSVASTCLRIDPSIKFWAPTRTQVVPDFVKFWQRTQIPPNFSIRPSAYHVGDSAPTPLSTSMAHGTSVLTEAQSTEFRGVYYDHQCKVYDLGKGEKECALAKPPGWKKGDKVGCRACWIRPDLAVNYVAH